MNAEILKGMIIELFSFLNYSFESEKDGVLTFFSSEDSSVVVPIFFEEESLIILLKILSEEKANALSEVLRHSLITICSSGLKRVDDRGEVIAKAPYCFAVNLKLIDNSKEGVRQSFAKFIEKEGDVTCELLFKAYFFGYICHELRHLFQINNFNHHDSISFLWNDYSLCNKFIPHDELMGLWLAYVSAQINGYYEKHYSNNPHKEVLISMECDALMAQIFAFDCYLCQMSEAERRRRILEIIQNK